MIEQGPIHNARLVGVVDPYAEKNPYWPTVKEQKIPRYDNLSAFIANHQADLAVIASPTYLHCPQTCDALQAGLPVLCEKPIAGSIQDVHRMITARDEAGKFAAIGYDWSFYEGIQAVKRDVMTGLFGRPVRLKTIVLWPRPMTYYNRNNWAGKLRMPGGEWVLDSPVNNATAHYLHNMFYILGSAPDKSALPSEVGAELYRANDIENYDTAGLRAKTGDGADILFVTSHAVDRSWPIRCEFIFERAKVEYEENAYDDDTATYARDHHNIDEPVWSSYLILTHQEIKSDKIRFWARRGSEVDSVDIDIYIDRGAGYAWEDVYEGDFANKTWVEKNFTGGEGLVDKARIRFHATSAKNGFFWELYEFNFFKTGLLYPNPATTPGILISTNLLEDQPLPIESVESFNYTASSKPADTTLRVQFSQDNVNWYNSAGVLGEWDILNEGFHSIDLSGLGWFGNNFYYKMEFYSNPQRDATPVLDEISVSFIMPYPIEACLSANPIRTITCEYRKVACEEDETTVCSISKDTSAHVGNKDKYGNVGEPGFKVCCKLSL